MFCTSGVPTGNGPVVAHSCGLLINTPFIGLPLHPVLLPCSLTCLLEQVASPKSLSKHLFLWTPKSSFTFLLSLPTRRNQAPSLSLQGPHPSLPLCSASPTLQPRGHQQLCPPYTLWLLPCAWNALPLPGTFLLPAQPGILSW